MVTLNNQKMLVDSLFNKIIADAEENIDGHIIEHQIHYF